MRTSHRAFPLCLLACPIRPSPLQSSTGSATSSSSRSASGTQSPTRSASSTASSTASASSTGSPSGTASGTRSPSASASGTGSSSASPSLTPVTDAAQCSFTVWVPLSSALDGSNCTAVCGGGTQEQGRAFLGPQLPAAVALCNVTSQLQRTAACNTQACPVADTTAFPFVSFATVVSGSASDLSLTTGGGVGGNATDGDASQLLPALQLRQELRSNVSSAVQQAVAAVLADGSVTVSAAAMQWLRNLTAADVLLAEPAGDASTGGSTVSVGWRVVLPLLGAAGGASSVDSGLQALLASPEGKAVAAEISLLVAAAVRRACADAGAASSGLLGSCPAGMAPLAISDPATQLQAAPTPSASPGTGGDSLARGSESSGAPEGE